MINSKILNLLFVIVVTVSLSFTPKGGSEDKYTDYVMNDLSDNLVLVWKDSSGNPLQTFDNVELLAKANGKKLAFAMNAGMYTTTSAPLGLYIEKGKQLKPLNKRDGYGNFYMMPNGVFYVTHKNEAHIVVTDSMGSKEVKAAKYATQSGPMLLVNDKVHSAFRKGSANINIRNGVGILPNGGVVFSISNQPVNFYDFAMHFKEMGCKNALYLDGAISKMYYPKAGLTNKWKTNFGVIIAVLQ